MIGLISIFILIALGILNANAFISAKHPKLKQVVDKTTPFESYIGFAGIIFGLFEILESLSYFSGMRGFISLVIGILTVTLGILSASGLLKENLFRDNAAMRARLDQYAAMIGVYQQQLGLGAIALAIIYLLMMIGM